MFRQFLRMQFLSPQKVSRMLTYLPQFARVFWRLMGDARVSALAKAVPILALIAMFTPPAIELDFVPIVGELDWVLVTVLTLKLFVWLCPADVVREHVSRVARGV